MQNLIFRPYATACQINVIDFYHVFFFFFNKNVIYTNGYSMHEEHRANPENTRKRKQGKNIKENQSTK